MRHISPAGQTEVTVTQCDSGSQSRSIMEEGEAGPLCVCDAVRVSLAVSGLKVERCEEEQEGSNVNLLISERRRR